MITSALLLAGDVGATKTDMAIFSSQAGLRAPLVESTVPTANYPSLAALVVEFLAQVDLPVDQAVFAVAGTIIDDQVSPTISNLPWGMDKNHLEAALGLSVRLINDLKAIALSIPFLQPDDLHTLRAGRRIPGGAIGVIAPGTGLGEAFLIWDGARYQPCVSEGGLASFAPANPFEVELLRYVRRSFEHVSCESVCSGLGIPNIYNCLEEHDYAGEPAWLSRQLATAEDPTPVIVNAALDKDAPCELCVATLDHFVSILGTEAGNLALKVVATGGMYLGGGIPPRILAFLEKELFLEAFWNKGVMTEMMVNIPVHVIVNSQAALLGAACLNDDFFQDADFRR